MPVLHDLAEACTGFCLEQVPSSALQRAKYAVLDAICNCLEGSRIQEISRPLLRMADASPGKCTVFGTGRFSALREAVLYNIAVGSATARNDHHAEADVHPGSILVPALWAESEEYALSGKDFLRGLLAGYEIMIRMGLALKRGSEYPPPESLRASMLPAPVGIAFALAAAKHLDSRTAANAAALACHHLCGIEQWRLEGTGEDVYQNAWDTLNGMLCVRMAENGVQAAPGNLDGEYGFLHLFGAESNASMLLDGLFRRYRILEVNSKVTGVCARVLAPCQLAQELNEDPSFSLDKLSGLRIRINKKCTTRSWYTAKRITCQSESINSVPFAVAATLVSGNLEKVSWFPPYDEQALALAERIELIYDGYCRDHLDPDGYRIDAQMRDGTVLIKGKRHYAPMTEEQIGTRFLSVASDTCGKEFADRIYETILSLEYVRSI